jgi:tRNA C32,U32 (ribose-2'-O)-methylase TrmJ
MTCPVCDSHTSSVRRAVLDGEPCPYCGASADLIAQVNDLRARNVEESLVVQLTELRSRAEKAEAEVGRLRGVLSSVRWELDRLDQPTETRG